MATNRISRLLGPQAQSTKPAEPQLPASRRPTARRALNPALPVVPAPAPTPQPTANPELAAAVIELVRKYGAPMEIGEIYDSILPEEEFEDFERAIVDLPAFSRIANGDTILLGLAEWEPGAAAPLEPDLSGDPSLALDEETLTGLETVIGQSLTRINEHERACHDATIYDRVRAGLGFWHVQHHFQTSGEGKDSTVGHVTHGAKNTKSDYESFREEASGQFTPGFRKWFEEREEGFGVSRRTASRYICLVQNLGLTLQTTLDEIDQAESEQRWHALPKALRDLYRSPGSGEPAKPLLTKEEADEQLEMEQIYFSWTDPKEGLLPKLAILGLRDKTWAHLPAKELKEMHYTISTLKAELDAALKAKEHDQTPLPVLDARARKKNH